MILEYGYVFANVLHRHNRRRRGCLNIVGWCRSIKVVLRIFIYSYKKILSVKEIPISK